MAKLNVSPELLVQALFGDSSPGVDVHIRGAAFDEVKRVIVLEIDGLSVPACESVRAEVTVARKTVSFKPV